ncbi:MAG: TetR/AcrR family transcriptional regulator [Hamadaea sp.]|uniref:TetR/AcrR family transcriptional regulator n=1 Tax=Hamadaea sp. TaxID=2024425 RepID=UPI0017D73236|nr:TetR/AcrR family transcriptional regulator [Hamadaea sp.]NUR72425.1 TetR/AcrR family transcriptional regulator [Hamadaea sp.]NUT19951.1 TetR/AcrR family transcriptional regulator [Hamadaea sp.]
MGNREDLLEGAKRCLYEKGYVRTTARDIATAAGVSLAAIGYHYGTKDALLNAALLQALEEWGEDLARAMTVDGDPAASPEERFAAAWDQVLRSFEKSRPLWRIQFELVGHLDANPELQATFAAANQGARLALVELFGTLKETLPDPAAQLALGTFYQALLGGVATQWLVDPGTALTGGDLLTALSALGTPRPR